MIPFEEREEDGFFGLVDAIIEMRKVDEERRKNTKIRKEVHSRCRFAYEEGEKHLKQVLAYQKGGGNIFTCKAMYKFLKARKIYIHYTNEYQHYRLLPFTK